MKYRFTGDYFADGDDKMLLFRLDEPEMIKVQEIVVPVEPEEDAAEGETAEENTKTVKKEIVIFTQKPGEIYGRPVSCLRRVNIAEQKHYSGNWNVLCPAKAVEELNVFTVDMLDGLLIEANKIIEGWTA